MKNIVFDLEGVLINDKDSKLLNTEALLVLPLAKRDFATVSLWSFLGLDIALKIARDVDLLHYFDFIIGRDYSEPEPRNFMKYLYGRNSSPLGRDLGVKNLMYLGDPRDYVILDDMPEFCSPRSRVVKVEHFSGVPTTSLSEAYEKAKRMF